MKKPSFDYKKMAMKHNKDMKAPINPDDPYAFMGEFSLDAHDRAVTDKARKDQEANPFGKAKRM